MKERILMSDKVMDILGITLTHMSEKIKDHMEKTSPAVSLTDAARGSYYALEAVSEALDSACELLKGPRETVSEADTPNNTKTPNKGKGATDATPETVVATKRAIFVPMTEKDKKKDLFGCLGCSAGCVMVTEHDSATPCRCTWTGALTPEWMRLGTAKVQELVL